MYISTLDLTCGYGLVPVTPAAQPLTTFNHLTSTSLESCPLGCMGIQVTFQCLMVWSGEKARSSRLVVIHGRTSLLQSCTVPVSLCLFNQFLDAASRNFDAFGHLVDDVALFHQCNKLFTHFNTQMRFLLQLCASFLVANKLLGRLTWFYSSNAVCLKFYNKENCFKFKNKENFF